MKACFASEMRGVDKAASEIGGIPSIVLMENAAMACVEELKNDFANLSEKSVAVFCGKGNNGGDGFAIARHLYNMGIDVAVYLVCGNEFKGDAKINFDIIKRMNINIDVISDIEDLKYIVRSYDIIVDAIFGTGISGTVRGISYDVISEINDNAKYIMAVDVPSGINSDSGEICGVCIKADKTVTFAAYKVGMLMFPAADYVGKAAVKNISIPDYIIDGQNLKINVIDDKFVRSNFPKRENNSQKGDYGKVLVIAGSAGMTGAAYLSSQTAVTTGSGLVTLAVPSSLNVAMEAKTTEVMTVPLSDRNGRISAEAIVTGQDGEQYINITGNSGLATGGSGDVLAGTVASLVSRGINETVASAMAVYIHGLAGDIAKDKYGIESVTASKVMECIPCALRQILQVEN